MGFWQALKNKHVIVALLVAPILAVLTWYAVGFFLGDKPEEAAPAQVGSSYPLVERPGCRYAGGKCALVNEDFELALSLEGDALVIESVVALDYLLVGLRSANDAEPAAASAQLPERKRWRFAPSTAVEASDAVRIVAGVGGATWFGEASLTFTAPAARD